ncbi:MAG: helix-turn-helix transcriptional regulator [Actinomycetota bacterium]|nr:helix-turn-helix transcriptional regulator [Actinomycetota bacterium]
MQALCHDENGDGGSVFRSILDRVGDTWSLLVIGMLQAGPLRFTQLLRTVPGISRRMLTLTLRQLERDGLVAREAFAENPPRVEYRVTALGASISEPVLALANWVGANSDAIVAHRERYDDAEERRR